MLLPMLISAILIHTQVHIYDECVTTAYCSCEICCGEWAVNRQGPVVGAAGRELIPGYSVAADVNVYPLGTELEIDGQIYRVDDVGGGVNGYHLDIYCSNHEEALNYNTGLVRVRRKNIYE